VSKTTTKKAKGDSDTVRDAGPLATVKRKLVVNQEEGELTEPTPPPTASMNRKRKIEESPATVAREHKPDKQEEEGELTESIPSGSVRKKRKAEGGAAMPSREHLAPPKKATTRDVSPMSLSIAKEPAPPPSQPSDGAVSMAKSASSKSNGRPKFKRGSSIYTSSEDEGGPPSVVKTQPAPQAKSHPSTSPVVKKREFHQRPIAPLPKEAAELRTRYKSTYLPYIITYQQVISEKTKLENALTGTFTDSDGDVDFMDAETLKRLAEEHRLYKDELESIQAAYSKAGGKGLLRPEVSRSSSSD
jgi:hypothetical protein